MQKLSFCLLWALLVAGCTTAAPQAVTLQATDIAYNVNQIEVVAGRPVQLTLQNDGALIHDFSIEALPHSGDVLVAEPAAAGEMAGHNMSHMADTLQIHMATPAGGRNTLTFTPSAEGTYVFFCTEPGHKEAGMRGTLVVQAP